jgi:histidinol-phosphate/aromatic aminotransferase/cobyric acid decarboxylase-like protein/adenosyl cobinamide kinase/adenosyl cobinamide phosphate guanylyltransferase
MTLVLVTGGTRSGKSAVAERLVAQHGAYVMYVATGSASDPEMAARIEAHRARRPAGWLTVEGEDPAAAVGAAGDRPVLVDSVGSWLAARLHEAGLLGDDRLGPAPDALLAGVRALATTASARAALTVVVTEEAGLGPIPVGAGTRRWLDLAGDAAQILAAAADRVLLVVAGRPIELPGGTATADYAAELPALRLHGDRMVPPDAADFAVNVERSGSSPQWLRAELDRALGDLGRYPDERPATEAVAARHGRDPTEVVLANGAADTFWTVAAALRPRRAVCVHPSFTEPEAALRAFGHPVERVARTPGSFTLDPGAAPASADLVVVGNPNNPTGTLDPADTVAALCRPGRTVLVDEAFMDFVPGERESLAGRADLPGLVVVRSLTKLWALPGVRAGYALAPPGLAEALRRVRQAWPLNTLALAALRACSAHVAEGEAVAGRVAAARDALRRALERIEGVHVWPSAANFLLLRVPDGPRVHARLLERGFAVRPAHTFPGLDPDHLRLTVREPASNARLVTALEEALA